MNRRGGTGQQAGIRSSAAETRSSGPGGRGEAAAPDGSEFGFDQPAGRPGFPGGSGEAESDGATLDSDLLPIVTTEILPGLHLKYGPSLTVRDDSGCPRPPPLDPSEMSAFVDHLVRSELDGAWACVESMRKRGASAEWVILELFTGAAVELGRRWEDDISNFAEVTIAMSHLGAFLRRNSEEFLASGRHHRMDCRILMAPSPGEQHTFGLGIASEYFLRAGFDVHTHGESSVQSLVDHVRDESFDVIGLSLGAVRHKEALQSAIRRLRRVARQRSMSIVVGGPVFALDPELHREVGADLVIADIREAPLRVMKLVKLLARRHSGR